LLPLALTAAAFLVPSATLSPPDNLDPFARGAVTDVFSVLFLSTPPTRFALEGTRPLSAVLSAHFLPFLVTSSQILDAFFPWMALAYRVWFISAFCLFFRFPLSPLDRSLFRCLNTQCLLLVDSYTPSHLNDCSTGLFSGPDYGAGLDEYLIHTSRLPPFFSTLGTPSGPAPAFSLLLELGQARSAGLSC